MMSVPDRKPTLMEKIHAETMEESTLCSNYLHQHYSQFNKKRFPFLFTEQEVERDVYMERTSLYLKLPIRERLILAGQLSSKPKQDAQPAKQTDTARNEGQGEGADDASMTADDRKREEKRL